MTTKSRVKGMITGIIVGDALGMPVEGWSAEKIKEIFPTGVKSYISPADHKYHKDRKAGQTTDDAFFTYVTGKAILDSGDFDMDRQASYHAVAVDQCYGMGKTTKEALERLKQGVSWTESGKSTLVNRGTGNGVPMKLAYLSAWFASHPEEKRCKLPFNEMLRQYCKMTHYNGLAVDCTTLHANLLFHLLNVNPLRFTSIDFFSWVKQHFAEIETNPDKDLEMPTTSDRIQTRMELLEKKWFSDYLVEDEEIRAEFGNGSYYVYDSLPFSYAFFVRNPTAIESIYDTVKNGGDTDTNASIVGGMVGALNGVEIFEEDRYRHLVDGVENYKEHMELAEGFCDKFGIK